GAGPSDAGVNSTPIKTDSSCSSLPVGPAGGTLVHASGARLVIPVGAIATQTTVTLCGIAPPASNQLGGQPLAQGVEAGPSGLSFLKPVQLMLPFDATRLSPGAKLSSVRVQMAPHGSSAFVALQSDVDFAEGLVRIETAHFTQFVPAQNDTPVFIDTLPDLPTATVGVPYAQTLGASGGAGRPYSWRVAATTQLPPGLQLDAGLISGTPTTPSIGSFFLVAQDTAAHSVQQAFAMTVLPANNPLPVLNTASPAAALAGGDDTTIALTGSGFEPTSEVLWDDAPLPSAFVNDTTLGATVSAALLADVAEHTISIRTPVPGGGVSASVAFSVTAGAPNPLPTLTSVSPAQIPGSTVATQVQLTGAHFVSNSSGSIAGVDIPTQFVSSTQLNTTIPAANLSAAGTVLIKVHTPGPGGGYSTGSVSVAVTENPTPVITGTSPETVVEGRGALTLTVTGNSFVSGARMFFNSTALTTTFVSDTEVQGAVIEALVARANPDGAAVITVVNPTPGGGSSNAVDFGVSVDPDGGNDAGCQVLHNDTRDDTFYNCLPTGTFTAQTALDACNGYVSTWYPLLAPCSATPLSCTHQGALEDGAQSICSPPLFAIGSDSEVVCWFFSGGKAATDNLINITGTSLAGYSATMILDTTTSPIAQTRGQCPSLRNSGDSVWGGACVPGGTCSM
ncbi:MAG: hypothetical protein ABI488_20060, partial [Polyangiaceae bacterium]